VPTVASDIRSGSRVASVAMRAEAAEGQGTHYSRRNPAHHPLIHESGVPTLLVDRSVAAVTDVADCIVILVKGEKVFEGHRAKNRSIGGPILDLAEVLAAQMIVIAERYDSGKLTVAEFESEKASAVANFNSQAIARENSAAMVNAAQSQALAAQQQARQQAIRAAVPTTCTSLGNTVTCY
jgi:hypothetical protein